MTSNLWTEATDRGFPVRDPAYGVQQDSEGVPMHRFIKDRVNPAAAGILLGYYRNLGATRLKVYREMSVRKRGDGTVMLVGESADVIRRRTEMAATHNIHASYSNSDGTMTSVMKPIATMEMAA